MVLICGCECDCVWGGVSIVAGKKMDTVAKGKCLWMSLCVIDTANDYPAKSRMRSYRIPLLHGRNAAMKRGKGEGGRGVCVCVAAEKQVRICHVIQDESAGFAPLLAPLIPF